VNVPPSEVTLTSRRAHFLLIASIADISSSFTRELQLPPLSQQQQQQLSHLHHHHLTLPSTTNPTPTPPPFFPTTLLEPTTIIDSLP